MEEEPGSQEQCSFRIKSVIAACIEFHVVVCEKHLIRIVTYNCGEAFGYDVWEPGDQKEDESRLWETFSNYFVCRGLMDFLKNEPFEFNICTGAESIIDRISQPRRLRMS